MLPKIDKPREQTLDNLNENVQIYIDYLKTRFG